MTKTACGLIEESSAKGLPSKKTTIYCLQSFNSYENRLKIVKYKVYLVNSSLPVMHSINFYIINLLQSK